MKKTVLIVLIVVLSIAAMCLGVAILMMPEPAEPAYVDPHTPNSLIEKLGIERPNRKTERLLVLRTYEDEVAFEDILEIAKVGGLEYHELDDRADDYILVIPFEINGKLYISDVEYDTFEEKFVEKDVIYKCNGGEVLPDNYCLLLRYSRPENPEYQLQLVQTTETGHQVATYQIVNTEGDDPVKTTQFVKDDIDAGTESTGKEIEIEKVEEN